ncbi:MAG: enoyl-CoA hydratase/isomerase family protein [Hyphomicrobium sp.]
MEKTDAHSSCLDISLKIEGSLALITLHRPHYLNALSLDMRASMASWLGPLSRDPQVYAVVIQSGCEKAFSVGADVKEIMQICKNEPENARKAFREEYTLNWQIECFSKPIISLIDGYVMGGGVGISLYGTHRVAGEKYSFAMPETRIGFFPDVGVSRDLASMPASIGLYLGLTGRSIARADAYYLGLATHCISSQHFEKIKRQLADTMPVDPLLDDLHKDPGEGELVKIGDIIERCFSGSNVENIFANLESEQGKHRPWATKVLADLKQKSPTSLSVTFNHIQRSKGLDLREVLLLDYQLACRFLDDIDFHEGVRAYLIEKDGHPQWSPNSLGDTVMKKADAYLAEKDYNFFLPSRLVMQSRND